MVLEDRPVYRGQLVELNENGIMYQSGQSKQGRLALHKELMVGLLEALECLIGANKPA